MEIKEIIKREIEEEKSEYLCDYCLKIFIDASCGRIAYILSDGACQGCGGKVRHFCSLECLKEFVSKLRRCEEND